MVSPLYALLTKIYNMIRWLYIYTVVRGCSLYALLILIPISLSSEWGQTWYNLGIENAEY